MILKNFDYEEKWDSIKKKALADGMILVKRDNIETCYSPDGSRFIQYAKIKDIKSKSIKIDNIDDIKKMSAQEFIDWSEDE